MILTGTLRRLALAAAVCSLAALIAARPGPAQVPFTAVGLGYPVPAEDARSAAMGGAGVSLLGGTASAVNPADLALVSGPMMNMTAAPERVELSAGSETLDFGHTRFSMLRVVIPVGRDWALSGAVKPLLDQDWEILVSDTLSVGNENFPFQERRRSSGGATALELSGARELGPVSVGVSAERVLGGLEQSFRRRFEQDTAGGDVAAPPTNVRSRGTWEYSGWRIRAGASLQLSDRARVGGVATWAGDLEAEPRGPAETREFDLPTSLELGASVRPTDELIVSLNGGWSGWSSAAEDFREVQALDTRWGGVGLELAGARVGPVALRLRGGARIAELPFAPEGGEQAVERSLTFGVGAVAGQGRGLVDLALELGSRGDVQDVGIEESYRRITLSFTLRP